MPARVTDIPRTRLFLLLFGVISFLNAQGVDDPYTTFRKSINENPISALTESWKITVNGIQNQESKNLPLILSGDIRELSFENLFRIVPDLRKHTLRLWFTGIHGSTQIYLNENLLRTRTDHISAFYIDVPANVLNYSGDNRLRLLVRNTENESDRIPSFVRTFAPEKYTGISGKIYLEWIKKISFDELSYRHDDRDIRFSYRLFMDPREEAATKIRLDEILYSPQGRPVFSRFEYFDFTPGNKRNSRTVRLPEIDLWSPGFPQLYTLELRVTTSRGEEIKRLFRIGFKNIAFKINEIELNGQNFDLIGITYRPEYARNDLDKLRRDFLHIKKMGFNSIRFPQGEPHPYGASIADSLGLFILVENPIWRLPESKFLTDHLLQNSKTLGLETASIFTPHPSLFAYGIGHEIPVHKPGVRKFVTILKEFLQQKFDLLCYISPLDYEKLPATRLTDFYMINKYDLAAFKFIQYEIPNIQINNTGPFILGNIGFSRIHLPEAGQVAQGSSLSSVITYYKMFYSQYRKQDKAQGLILESFTDWQSIAPNSRSLQHTRGAFTYPYGIISGSGEDYSKDPDFLTKNITEDYSPLTIPAKKTNFFSVTIFIFSIVFFLIFRQNYRLRENVKRSLIHPYGFFVDLRDRRIISIFNSAILGLYTNLLVANLFAAYLYYYNDNLLIEEILTVVSSEFSFTDIFRHTVQSPIVTLGWLLLILYMIQVLAAFLLKVINLFSGEKIRFRQALAVCNWSGTHFIYLIPLSMFAYHMIEMKDIQPYIYITILIFAVWYNYRLINGIRVLFVSRPLKVTVFVILSYLIVIFILSMSLDSVINLVDYVLLLTESSNLF